MTSSRAPLSAVVTTFNNASTLQRCLQSVAWCDEIVVLDSGSTDATRETAERFNAKWGVQAFAGYGPQKQAAIERASHDWILLLDADEFLQPEARTVIEAELRAPRADGYRLPRQEWLFWRWPHRATRGNHQLRFFRKSQGGMNAVPVHAAPEVRGRVLDLDAPFRHYGEPELAVRVEKVNRYSSGLLEHTRGKRKKFIALRLLFYPTLAFLKLYIGKRYFLNGWAGFFAAKTQSFYAFLKYAKLLEAERCANAQPFE